MYKTSKYDIINLLKWYNLDSQKLTTVSTLCVKKYISDFSFSNRVKEDCGLAFSLNLPTHIGTVLIYHKVCKSVSESA